MTAMFLESFTGSRLTHVRRHLRKWFRQQGRSLPWRETQDPYRIWISEIMLQQTTVKAVIPYYERFLSRFPNIASLAAASEEEVLKYWEGLGYYSRGRNLRKAAILVCEDKAGEFPRDLEDLIEIPGIGRYTAGAIRSFAFNLPAPIVEANTLRLYCRLLNFAGDPRSREGQTLLWGFAELLQPRHNASEINQALMELGSQLCTPADPRCEDCPLKTDCAAFAEGNQNNVPLKKIRTQITQVVEATVAIRSDGRILIRQRQAGERWEGMWDFVRFPVETITYQHIVSKGRLLALYNEVKTVVKEMTGLEISLPTLLDDVRHNVTRYRIRLICLAANVNHATHSPDRLSSAFQWVLPGELVDRPMPITGREFANRLLNAPIT